MRFKFRVVFDTNIYISAILFGGNPRQILELARSKEINLFISKAILLELAKKLQNKFLWSEEDTREVLEGILVFTNLIVPSKKVNIIKNDPPDNRILEAALETKADYIVSGDKKHILSLKSFKNIPILTAKQFLDIFYQKG